MQITLDSVVAQAPEQVSCELGGEAAILNLKSGVYFGLDPVGAFIWKQLAEGKPARTIRDAVLAEYEVGEERCETDLLELLAKLQEAGLITVA